MADLAISIVQYNISWCNKESNFNYLNDKLLGISSDLIVLPEMFQTGFCVSNMEMAETMEGETMQWLKQKSNTLKTAICGSFLCQEDGLFFNRFVLVKEGDLVGFYDKVHLFSMGNEHNSLSGGNTKVDMVLNGFKIRPIVCYDLRFPYISFNDTEYDILLCPANWPSQRIAHWDAILKARSIENQAFVIACNRIGEQDGYFYPGHSSVYTPSGDQVKHSHKEEILEYTITKSIIEETRKKLPFLVDRKM